jgi:hypothetical protein
VLPGGALPPGAPLQRTMLTLLSSQSNERLEFLAGFIADLNQAARDAMAEL